MTAEEIAGIAEAIRIVPEWNVNSKVIFCYLAVLIIRIVPEWNVNGVSIKLYDAQKSNKNSTRMECKSP